MYLHLLSIDKNILCAITHGPYIPKDANDVVKHPTNYTDDETKKTLYDLKARNMFISTLSAKVFYSSSHHASDKGM